MKQSAISDRDPAIQAGLCSEIHAGRQTGATAAQIRAGRAAESRMAASHVAFVQQMAGRVARSTGHPADELFAAGLLGLSIGIARLTPMPNKPLSYLAWWVSKYVRDAAERMSRARSELAISADHSPDRPAAPSADRWPAEILAGLDPIDMRILTLCYVADRTVPSIASELDMPAAAIYRRRAAALASLKAVA